MRAAAAAGGAGAGAGAGEAGGAGGAGGSKRRRRVFNCQHTAFDGKAASQDSFALRFFCHAPPTGTSPSRDLSGAL